MRLTSKAILNYANVNQFSYGNQWIIRAQDTVTLYFQVTDLDQAGLRYMTGVGTQNEPVTLTVTFPTNAAVLNTFNNQTNGGFIPYGSTLSFPNIDGAQVFTVTAQQADPNDPSIFKIALGPVQIPNSGNVQFQLVEGTTVYRWFVTNMIDVQHLNSGGC